MLKKTITYTDYFGNERTEDFYFNLTKAECAELLYSEKEGLDKAIEKIINEKNNTKIIEFFKDFIAKAYGIKSDDGRRFIKSKEISEEFMQTEAYSNLFMELASNSDSASEFVKGVLPKVDETKLQAALEEQKKLSEQTSANEQPQQASNEVA